MNRKALLKAGPNSRPRHTRIRENACDRTAVPVWSAVGVGLHLLSLAYAGTVAHASLAGMTEIRSSSTVRELAEIPAVEVITRSAVMLMSAAAEKLGLSADDPDDSPHRDLDEARRLITALAGSGHRVGRVPRPARRTGARRAEEPAVGVPRIQRRSRRTRARARARSTPAPSGSWQSHPFPGLSEYPRGL